MNGNDLGQRRDVSGRIGTGPDERSAKRSRVLDTTSEAVSKKAKANEGRDVKCKKFLCSGKGNCAQRGRVAGSTSGDQSISTGLFRPGSAPGSSKTGKTLVKFEDCGVVCVSTRETRHV